MHTQLRYYRFVAQFVDAVTTQALTRSLHGAERSQVQPPVALPKAPVQPVAEPLPQAA